MLRTLQMEGENKSYEGTRVLVGERVIGLRFWLQQKVRDGSTYMICGFDCHAPQYHDVLHTVLTFTAHLAHIRTRSRTVTFFKKKKSLKDSYSIAEFQPVYTNRSAWHANWTEW